MVLRDDYLHKPGPHNAFVGQMGWDGMLLIGTAKWIQMKEFALV